MDWVVKNIRNGKDNQQPKKAVMKAWNNVGNVIKEKGNREVKSFGD